MNKALYIMLAAIAVSLGSMAGAAPEAHEGNATNQYCPVTQDEEIDPDIFVEYEGEKVFFCCNRCRKKFLADPTAYLATLPQFAAGTDVDPASTHTETSHDHGSHETTPEDKDEHDHELDHGPTEDRSALKFLGKFHPLVVHFPIALILVALLAEGLTLWSGGGFFRDAARFALSLGAAGALAAAPLGWLAASGAGYPEDLMRVLFFHRWLGVSVGVVSVGAAVLSHLQVRNTRLLTAYRACLLLSAVLVGITGHLGATMIYGTDYFTW